MTDYRALRPSNINSEQFRHLKLLLYWAIFGILFYTAERVVPRRYYHTMWCPLDDRIPFCEWFMIPYMFWFVFLVGMHLYLLLNDIPAFRRMMRFIILTCFRRAADFPDLSHKAAAAAGGISQRQFPDPVHFGFLRL